MSRKSRRNRAKQPVRGATPPVRSTKTESPVRAEPLMAAAAPAVKTAIDEALYFNVINEIRRIGIMGGAMIIILIILAIILS